ncbi:MAG: transcription-repair coupling factor [Tissierellia bacterium]|nr:transcription-repair coupling factor [Tissierellia bacterium]
MNYLIDILDQLEEYKDIKDKLKGDSSIYIHGMVKESIPHFIYALQKDLEKSIFVVVRDELRAKEIFESASSIPDINLSFYPKSEIGFYNIKPLESDSDRQRIQTMNSLAKGERSIIIASQEALVKKISTPKYFIKSTLNIRIDDEVDIDNLVKKLGIMQYERVSTVESKGQFAVRGGIIDIYPIDYEDPVRVELFDTEIDSIRTFRISDQRSVSNIDSFTVTPAREFLLTEADKDNILKGIQRDLDKAENSVMYGIDKDLLIEKFEEIRSFVESDIILSNPDLVMPYIKKNSYSSILDYLDRDTVVVFEDVARIYDRASENEKRYDEDLSYQIEKGEVFSSHEKIPFRFKDILKEVKEFNLINITQLTKRTSLLSPDSEAKITTVETQGYNRNFTLLKENIEEYVYRGYKTVIMAQNKEKAESLIGLLASEGINANYRENLSDELKTSQVIVTPFSFSKGFEYKKLKLVFITHNEIYGKSLKKNIRKKKKKLTGQEIISYSDLVAGDYIVHENHGIGIYRGIKQIEVAGKVKDYLVLEYRGTDKLFIPTDQMNLIQKYIGADARSPKLNKLGGAEWIKTKQRAKKALAQIADDLVELYAKRSKQKGFSFSTDTPWQREFEDAFIYEETGAQIRSIKEIKGDMESDKPMERLLCGDVGYGKTEVAFRAAFKAIMDGKQVAFLVPTTILAQQHYLTAVERFKDFPVKVEMISRFRTASQQSKILKDVSGGYVDLLIGTHRLLSKDLKFKDLGLLIIDEEQRFGVRHKDKLKVLRENIDVLMLSATPIPRTLQMGLVGIKDMSLLDEAPEERYPTTTYVVEYEPMVIREAVIREIERGGQVYFVYNRVYDIDEMAFKLKELIPEAEIITAHGRMRERSLEKVMIDFTEGKYDILLSTSIIETGLDIHNVNTMIIYNADHMGLSQLYQLKGRIGRGDRTSYAYFTYEKGKSLTEISEKRLKAIRDFTEFGSGFKIAMRDLELRGAGNILGESQHGHIDQIGYDLYVKMLEQAIKYAKGDMVEEKEREINIDMGIDSYIPSDYIVSNSSKIEIYKRIASIDSLAELEDMIGELIDRFGDVPKPVVNVMYISLIKSLAQKIGFTQIIGKEGKIIFEYEDMDLFSIEEFKYLSDEFKDSLEFSLSTPPSLIIKAEKRRLNKGYLLLDKIIKYKKSGKA